MSRYRSPRDFRKGSKSNMRASGMNTRITRGAQETGLGDEKAQDPHAIKKRLLPSDREMQ